MHYKIKWTVCNFIMFCNCLLELLREIPKNLSKPFLVNISQALVIIMFYSSLPYCQEKNLLPNTKLIACFIHSNNWLNKIYLNIQTS